MKRFFQSNRFLIATLAVLIGAGWVAVTEEQYFQAPIRVNAQAYFTQGSISYAHNTTGITASTGATQATATQLTKEYSAVSTVATAGDSVKLFTPYAGSHAVITNLDSADTLAVFAPSGGTLDGATGAISVPAGATLEAWGTSSTAWKSSAGFWGTTTPTSINAGVTAATGSAQGDGPITKFVTQVTTSGTAGDALTLPPAAAGLVRMVCNHAASNAVDLFPASSDRINKESANTAISLAAGECAFCIAADAVYWGCVIGSAN